MFFSILEIWANGTFILLSDGHTACVNEWDTFMTNHWSPSQHVVFQKLHDGTTYRLSNLELGQSVQIAFKEEPVSVPLERMSAVA